MQKQKVKTMIPHQPQLERAVLGAMLVDSAAYYLATSQQQLTINDFYTDLHAKIFECICKIAAKNGKIDLVTVGKEFIAIGGDLLDLTEIAGMVGSTANVEYHVQCLKQVTMRRQLIAVADKAQKAAFDASNDIFDVVQFAQKEVLSITDKLTKTADNIDDILEEIDRAAAGIIEESNAPISTGITDLDKNICGGVERDDYFVIGADSGVGKTALMFCMVLSFLENDKRCAVFSYEMKTKKLLIRLICAKAEIRGENLKMGTLTEDEAQRYEMARYWLDDKLKKNLLHIFDCSGMPIDGLKAKCIAMNTKHPLDGIFIDYMQLIPTGQWHRDANEATSQIARELMHIKNYIGVPIVALSQLRKTKLLNRPCANDLLGAQALENCASKILLIDRPQKRDIMEFADGTSTIGKAEIYIDKNREGGIACERISYSGEYFKFTNLQPNNYENAAYF